MNNELCEICEELLEVADVGHVCSSCRSKARETKNVDIIMDDKAAFMVAFGKSLAEVCLSALFWVLPKKTRDEIVECGGMELSDEVMTKIRTRIEKETKTRKG